MGPSQNLRNRLYLCFLFSAPILAIRREIGENESGFWTQQIGFDQIGLWLYAAA